MFLMRAAPSCSTRTSMDMTPNLVTAPQHAEPKAS